MNDDARLLELLGYAADRGLTDAEATELRPMLESNPEAREQYAMYLLLHADLAWERRETTVVEAPEWAASAGRPSRFRINAGVWAIAATLAFAAAVVAIYVFVIDPPTQDPNPTPRAIPVATLIQTTGGTLVTPNDYPSEGRQYEPGLYTLERGFAHFILTNSVNVTLRGDTRAHIHNNMLVSLAAGHAEFDVPRGAIGFAVDLPDDVRVVDLGTRFAVGLRPDRTVEVAVADGRVRVQREDWNRELVRDGSVYHLSPTDGLVRIDAPVAIDPSILADEEPFVTPDGLDLKADGWRRVYAINAGAGVNVYTVGGIAFDPSDAPQGTPGIRITSQKVAQGWGLRPEFGDDPDAEALESIMSDIRWSSVGPEAGANEVKVDARVETGKTYRLTLLFAENYFTGAGERTFDIAVEGLKLRDEFDVLAAAGGQSRGVAVTYTFIARDDELNVSLLPGSDALDGNPILNALTLFELAPRSGVEPTANEATTSTHVDDRTPDRKEAIE